MEHCPSWIRLGDLRTVHNRIHYVLGVFFMAIPLVIHCLIIFLPAMNGVPLSLVANVPPSKASRKGHICVFLIQLTPVFKVTPFIFANNNTSPTSAQVQVLFVLLASLMFFSKDVHHSRQCLSCYSRGFALYHHPSLFHEQL